MTVTLYAMAKLRLIELDNKSIFDTMYNSILL